MRRLRSWLIGSVITIFWLLMIGSLMYRYVLPARGRGDATPLDTNALADTWRDSEEWMELRWNGLPVGVLRAAARRVVEQSPQPVSGSTDPGSAVSPFHVVMQTALGLGPIRLRMTASALLTEQLHLDQFQLVAETGNPEKGAGVRMHLDGLVRGTTLLLRITRDEQTAFHSVALGRPVALSDSIRPLFSRTDLKVGDRYTLPVFDPIWNMQGGTMTIRVAASETLDIAGESVETLKIETELGKMRTTTWVDELGQVRQREIPPLLMTALTPDEALRRQPWMGRLPDVPRLRPEQMQGTSTGDPLRGIGLMNLISESAAPEQTPPKP